MKTLSKIALFFALVIPSTIFALNVNDNFRLETPVALADNTANGNVTGLNVNIASSWQVNQTTQGVDLTLAPPTVVTRAGLIINLANVGTAQFQMYSIPIMPGRTQAFVWSGSNWQALDRTNSIGWADTRGINLNPRDYSGGVYWDFKQSSVVGLNQSGVSTYCGLMTYRRYSLNVDFSGGQVRQECETDNGNKYFRLGAGATTWGLWEQMPRANQVIDIQNFIKVDAVARHSLNNEISWGGGNGRLIAIGRGVDTVSQTSGFHDIYMPAAGTAITTSSGATVAVVAATAGVRDLTGGIPLSVWQCALYNNKNGTNNTTINANFLIQSYTDAIKINGNDWLIIACRDGSDQIHWGDGSKTRPSAQFANSMQSQLQLATKDHGFSGNGYQFSAWGAAANTAIYGFSGEMIKISDGNSLNQAGGYRYIDQTSKVAGTIIYGRGGAANTTWRNQVASDEIRLFGAQNNTGSKPIGNSTVAVLNNYNTLYWAVNPDETTNNTGTWYVVNYNGNFQVPTHWIRIAQFDQSYIVGLKLWNNEILDKGESLLRGTRGAINQLANQGMTFGGGIADVRLTTAAFFSGTGANGAVNGANGAMLSFPDNTLMFGMEKGQSFDGNPYTWLNIPPVGTAIPVWGHATATRVVTNIGGKRFIPKSAWEALVYIPSQSVGGTSSVNEGWFIYNYNVAARLPAHTITVSKFASNGGINGNGVAKTRLFFAGSHYLTAGLSFAVGTPALNDHSHGSGDWRNVVIAGGTPPAATAPLPPVAGVVANYSAPYTMKYKFEILPEDARGKLKLSGLIQLTANIIAPSSSIAFIPGASVYDAPIHSVLINASTGGDDATITAQVRFVNGTIGGQNGILVQAYNNSFNVLINPLFTLGTNGNPKLAGALQWVNFNGIELPLQ